MAQHIGRWDGKTAEEHAAEPRDPEDTYVHLGEVLDYLRKDDSNSELVKKLLKKFGDKT